ncbi:ATP-binding protein [Allocoleopsis franciscana]|uniref:Circadian input-output histidine kinase CikA n=1 Tax=Allocoleopsis franciscana PCC 7113 TaxID=1173027 RepID=K9WE15_9CYAN|nr:ATP-binding protein [Allocoleopsis franciscana]AFZ18041.1 signal transduction histidine kinase [Allocoleopsis franciscana PCC 7113]
MTDQTPVTHTTEAATQGELLHRMTNRIRQSLELQEILSATATEMRAFLDTDRVKVYRFESDGTGQVIAESVIQNRLPSLLGLHFPAGDIPPHAREMFVKARVRSIIDIPTQRITLNRLDCPETTGDLTIEDVQNQAIEDILQRPVDPCHVEYLSKIGVQSSLVVPILHQQNLWGLLVSHHAQPLAFSQEQLQIVQTLADQVTIAISQSHLLSQSRERVRGETLINQISTLLHSPLQVSEILQIALEKVVQSVKGSGGRLFVSSTSGSSEIELYTYGAQPLLTEGHPTVLEHYPFWQQLMTCENRFAQPSNVADYWRDLILSEEEEFRFRSRAISQLFALNDIYQEPQLLDVAPLFRPTRIRSLLAMPLVYGEQCVGILSIFRDEIDTDILWAGRYDPDERQDRVRSSFEVWRELKLGQAREWREEEIEITSSVGTHLTMAVLQHRLYQCEYQQRVLVEMRNQQLNKARTVAEEASRLKSDFLSSTSHELRTPLAATLNYLKLLKEGFYDNEEELTEYISVAYNSAENLVAIINDVLDIAKIEAGRMTLNPELIDLPSLLEEQQNLFRLESRQKGISLVIECEVERVYADLMKLRQVLSNLLSNAFKFTPSGEIRLQVILETLANHPWVKFSVTDTGIGIEPAKQDMLFEPFVQADGSVKRRYGGTGLGLTVCKRLVELMGGEISLYSLGKGEGTSVTFKLPQYDLLGISNS